MKQQGGILVEAMVAMLVFSTVILVVAQMQAQLSTYLQKLSERRVIFEQAKETAYRLWMGEISDVTGNVTAFDLGYALWQIPISETDAIYLIKEK